MLLGEQLPNMHLVTHPSKQSPDERWRVCVTDVDRCALDASTDKRDVIGSVALSRLLPALCVTELAQGRVVGED